MKSANNIILNPAYDADSVTVCCATDDNYVSYCAVMLTSLIQHISSNYKYDLVILTTGLTDENREKILNLPKFLNAPSTISLRIHEVGELIGDKVFKGGQNGRHLPNIAYIRLFIPTIFQKYRKVIYLDIDITVLDDIANLYNEDLTDKWIGACLDYGIVGVINSEPKGKHTRLDYFVNTLGLKDPRSEYVCSGVMGFNIKELRANEVEKAWLKAAETIPTLYHDQDIINMICKEHVHFYDTAWNETNTRGLKYLPKHYQEKVLDDQLNHKITHWPWVGKPWNMPSRKTAYIWWNVARTSPFYEEIIYKNICNLTLNAIDDKLNELHKTISVDIVKREIFRTIYEISKLKKYNLQRIKYKFLSMITFGSTRLRYNKKKRELKFKIKAIKDVISSF